MPQMFPMSWIFIYIYVILGLVVVILVVSYWTEYSVTLDSELEGDFIESLGVIWLW